MYCWCYLYCLKVYVVPANPMKHLPIIVCRCRLPTAQPLYPLLFHHYTLVAVIYTDEANFLLISLKFTSGL